MENNFIQLQISSLVKKVNSQKEELLLKRIKERVFLDSPMKWEDRNFHLNQEIGSRFPRIMKESHPNQEERYYWNDGTKEGIHLITFYQEQEEKSIKEVDNKFELSLIFKYK